jgi:hypothetical protein
MLVQLVTVRDAIDEAHEFYGAERGAPTPSACSADDPDPAGDARRRLRTTAKQVLIFKQSAARFDAPRAFVLASVSCERPDFATQFIVGEAARKTHKDRQLSSRYD